MNGINYIIIKENNTRKTKRIEKKLKTCISKFGPYIIILLKDFEIKFFICNMKKNTKLDGKGCYFLTNEHNKWIINIYIDNCKYFNDCWDGDMIDNLALDKAIEIVKGGGVE